MKHIEDLICSSFCMHAFLQLKKKINCYALVRGKCIHPHDIQEFLNFCDVIAVAAMLDNISHFVVFVQGVYCFLRMMNMGMHSDITR